MSPFQADVDWPDTEKSAAKSTDDDSEKAEVAQQELAEGAVGEPDDDLDVVQDQGHMRDLEIQAVRSCLLSDGILLIKTSPPHCATRMAIASHSKRSIAFAPWPASRADCPGSQRMQHQEAREPNYLQYLYLSRIWIMELSVGSRRMIQRILSTSQMLANGYLSLSSEALHSFPLSPVRCLPRVYLLWTKLFTTPPYYSALW